MKNAIVKLIGADSRFFAIFLEHVKDQNLGAWCDSTGIFKGTRADAIQVLKDMADALLHLRQHKVLHNDIKPSNILYGRSGAILIDFGNSTDDVNPALGGGGTPWYVGPEYLEFDPNGQPIRGPPCDMWALGVVMIYLLRLTPLPDLGRQVKEWIISDVRRKPTDRDSMKRWVGLVGETRSNLNTDNRVEDLVYRMLDRSPVSRIQPVELHRLAASYFGASQAPEFTSTAEQLP